MDWNTINWSGEVEINGVKYPSLKTALKQSKNLNSIILYSKRGIVTERKNLRVDSVPNTVYKVTVKQYMTHKSTPDFDFMNVWNNDVPMPLRIMVGTVEKETRGMVYMSLHGDITSIITTHCLKCGKPITNAVSQFFGMGPICGEHNYINPFASEEELKKAVEDYRKTYLQKITWQGWIPKSAITEQEEIN